MLVSPLPACTIGQTFSLGSVRKSMKTQRSFSFSADKLEAQLAVSVAPGDGLVYTTLKPGELRSGPVTLGEFHHVVLNWSAAGRELFLDGALAARDARGDSMSQCCGTFVFATPKDWRSPHSLPITVDDVRIYEAPLRSADVRQLWAEGSDVPGVAGAPRL